MKINKIFTFIILLLVSILFCVSSLAADDGCCTLTCKQADKGYCPGFFESGKNCNEIEQCNIGCCVDTEGYCLGNFLKGNCERLEGKFISKKECRQHVHCLTIPLIESLRDYTGFPFIFESEYGGVSSIIPISGERGDTFKIRAVISENEELDKVDAVINFDMLKMGYQLYNDGEHGDGNENDTIFANQFDSAQVPSFNGIKNLAVDIEAYKDNNITTSSTMYFTLIDNTKCLPVFKVWRNETEKDIIFAGYNYGDNTIKKELRRDANSVIGALSPLGYFENELDELNFYIILENVGRKDFDYIRGYTAGQCSLYDELEDYVILFDKNQLQCEQEGKLIMTNPVMYPNRGEITKIQDLDELMDNFCSYMLTEQELIKNEELKYEEPEITIIKPLNGSVFNTNEIDVEFVVRDSKGVNFDYEVYLDTSLEETRYLSGTTLKDVKTTGTLSNVPDGEHDLWVEATDSDGNMGFSEFRDTYVDVANFIIDLISPDKMAYNSSPAIQFKISHAFEHNVNYSVFVNDGLFADGKTAVNNIVSLPTNLTEGDYKISIYAEDSENRTTKSVPALILIDKGKPELEILNFSSSEITFRVGDSMSDYLMYGVYAGSTLIEESFIDVGLPKTVQLTGSPNVVTVTVVDLAGNRDTKTVTSSGVMPSPPAAGFDDVLLSILVMVLTFLIAIAVVLYHRK